MRQYTIKLDLDQPAKQPTSIVLNQANLDSVSFLIKIYQNGTEVFYFGYGGVEMVFAKPDGNNVVDEAELHEDGVHYDLRRELFEAPGMVTGYVNLYTGPGPDMPVLEPSELTASLYYTFMIVSDLLNTEIISRSYMSVIERVVSDLYNMWAIIEQMSNDLQSFSESLVMEWSNLSNTPTDLAGYGITDAVSKSGDNMTGQLKITAAAKQLLLSNMGGYKSNINRDDFNLSFDNVSSSSDMDYSTLVLANPQADTSGIQNIVTVNKTKPQNFGGGIVMPVTAMYTLWGSHNMPWGWGSETAQTPNNFQMSLFGQTTMGQVTYTKRNTFFYRIGALCYVEAYIEVSGITTQGYGVAVIGSIPNASTTPLVYTASNKSLACLNITQCNFPLPAGAFVSVGEKSYQYFTVCGLNSDGTMDYLQVEDWPVGGYLGFSGFYRVAVNSFV